MDNHSPLIGTEDAIDVIQRNGSRFDGDTEERM